MKYLIACLFAALSFSAQAYNAPGQKWGDPTVGTGAVVHFSFLSSDYDCRSGNCFTLDSTLPSNYNSAIFSALETWSSVANITFQQVGYGHLQFYSADFSDSPFPDTPALMYNTPQLTGEITQGVIGFNINNAWGVPSTVGSQDLYSIALFNVGLSLGLKKSDVSGSIMNLSYLDSPSSGLHDDDIAGIQYLYGSQAGSVFALDDSTPTVSPVPEPSSWAMMILGLMVLWGLHKFALRTPASTRHSTIA